MSVSYDLEYGSATLELQPWYGTNGSNKVVIVDDGSDEEHRLEDLVESYSFKIKLIRVEPEEKWYVNPCVPYNVGFKAATGDIVIIQNPECCHVGDIIKAAADMTTEERYISFHTYALDQKDTASLKNISISASGDLPFKFKERGIGTGYQSGYYNHVEYRPVGFHFCNSIRRSHLVEMGGFDERYAHGIGYDDNELLVRVLRKGLQLLYAYYPLALHQNHYKKEIGTFDDAYYGSPKFKQIQKNALLFMDVTMKEKEWKANESVE